MRRLLVRYSVPAAGLLILAAFAVLYATVPQLYATLLVDLGLAPFRYPFLDGQYVLAGAECWHLGIDVYTNDPCDVLDRAHAYSPLWLRLPVIPMNMTIPLGISLAVIFVLALAAVAPVRRGRDFGLCLLALASPMVLFALERANVDVVIFLLVVAAGLLSTTLAGRWRLLTYVPLLLATLLKYYPITLLCVTLRERWRAFLIVTAASIAVIAIFIATFRAELLASLPNIPGGGYATGVFGVFNPGGAYFSDNFGAPVLLGGIAQIIAYGPAAPDAFTFRVVLLGVLTVASLLAAIPAVRMACTPAVRASIARLSPRHNFFLVSGAALVAGCFFAGQSIDYRGVHLLLVLPGFLALSQREICPERGALFWNASLVIVFLMWGDCFRVWLSGDSLGLMRLGLWFVRELLWWWLAGLLAGVLLCFALESTLFLELSARLRSGRAADADASAG
jgi:hypothetical protein